MAEKKEKRYVSDNAQLMAEWNWAKNSELNLTPTELTCGSNKKVWWKCSKAHEWQATINNRSLGQQCPICAGKKIVRGLNDLVTLNPSLAEEWDYEKNDIDPYGISPNSNKKAWWKCKFNHSWQATVSDRNHNHGCPFCALCTPGINDLATQNPSLALEWNYEKNYPLKPTEVNGHSSRSVWWIGVCGHEWKAKVGERNRSNRKGSGCPICNKGHQSSFQEQAIYFYISSLYPDAINGDRRYSLEFDIFIPSINTAIEYDGYLWHAKELRDNSDERKNLLCKEKGIRLIRILEPGLPTFDDCICICRNDMSDNSLETIIIHLLELISTEEYAVRPNLSQDRQNILAMYETSCKKNSLSALYPNIAKEWHREKNGKLSPTNITAKSGQKIWWKCSKCGYEWESQVCNRTKISRKSSGCPVCAGTIVVPGLNDFASEYPEISKEWHPTRNGKLTPDMVTKGSHRKVWWLGKCGHEWETHLHHRAHGSGCPYCANKLVWVGFNDIATTNPELLCEWDENNSILPTEVTIGSSKTVSWKCPNGHKYSMVISRRKKSGCPYCAGQKVLVGYNDIASTRPDLMKFWNFSKNSLSPYSITQHSNKTIYWKCEFDHEWESCPNDAAASCPYCSNRKVLKGFNDLLSKHPSLANEWNWEKNSDMSPDSFTSNSSQKVWWKCMKCGNEWKAMISKRAIYGSNCPNCQKQK